MRDRVKAELLAFDSLELNLLSAEFSHVPQVYLLQRSLPQHCTRFKHEASSVNTTTIALSVRRVTTD